VNQTRSKKKKSGAERVPDCKSNMLRNGYSLEYSDRNSLLNSVENLTFDVALSCMVQHSSTNYHDHAVQCKSCFERWVRKPFKYSDLAHCCSSRVAYRSNGHGALFFLHVSEACGRPNTFLVALGKSLTNFLAHFTNVSTNSFFIRAFTDWTYRKIKGLKTKVSDEKHKFEASIPKLFFPVIMASVTGMSESTDGDAIQPEGGSRTPEFTEIEGEEPTVRATRLGSFQATIAMLQQVQANAKIHTDTQVSRLREEVEEVVGEHIARIVEIEEAVVEHSGKITSLITTSVDVTTEFNKLSRTVMSLQARVQELEERPTGAASIDAEMAERVRSLEINVDRLDNQVRKTAVIVYGIQPGTDLFDWATRVCNFARVDNLPDSIYFIGIADEESKPVRVNFMGEYDRNNSRQNNFTPQNNSEVLFNQILSEKSRCNVE